MLNEELCEQLVLAARARDEQEIARVVGAMYQDVVSYVTGLCRGTLARFARKVGVTPGDVASHVSTKMLRRPPTNPNNREPQAAVGKWIRLVIMNWLRDQDDRRKTRERIAEAVRESTPSTTAPTEPETSEVDVELTALLDACYPRALPLFALVRQQALEDTDSAANDHEVATQLGMTPANIYKIRQRMRLYVGCFLELRRKPASSDLELCKALETTENDDFKRIVAKVRQYLARHRKGSN